VISPASLGLYALYFLGPIAAIPGMAGLALTLFHGAPGYDLSVAMGFVPSRTVVDGSLQASIEALNAGVWAAVYGTLGWLIDAIRARTRRVVR